jgi:phosphoribosylglycinamide formyltransferase 1
VSEPVSIAVMASGRGSNFRAIQEALAAMSEPPARIALCISNNPSPGAFDVAREVGIPTLRLSPKMFATEEEYASALDAALSEHSIEMIVLAGYMRKLPRAVVERFSERILNVHPALLPDFGGHGMYGMNVHEAVVAARSRESGATVHLVDADYDTGRIVAQERIALAADETPESLAARVLEVEHRLFPRVVIEWAERLREKRGTILNTPNA